MPAQAAHENIGQRTIDDSGCHNVAVERTERDAMAKMRSLAQKDLFEKKVEKHPAGRATFLSLDSGEARTLTGFEIGARVVDWTQPQGGQP